MFGLHSPEMDEIPLTEFTASVSVFSDSEIAEMENLFREVGEESLTQDFCQDLAASFNSSTCHAGKPTIQWEQVRSWFQDKQNEFLANATSGFARPKASNASKIPETSIVLKGGRAAELSELSYEAKSARDLAWYDVASFLTYRVLSATGELMHQQKERLLHYYTLAQCFDPQFSVENHWNFVFETLMGPGFLVLHQEARVRFAGFGSSHDEWVNVKKGIRERSIPLEPSECHMVKVGDLVMCFQERFDYALYVDAHIREIQRRLHDIKGCRCIFVVHYDDDNTEEKVRLDRICRRPS